MGDRVPIGTHPGLVSVLVDADLPIGMFAQTVSVSRLYVRRTGYAVTGQVTGALRNATAGGGDAIAFTLGDDVGEVAATGAITGTAFYLRVTAADTGSENLSGWFEVDPEAVSGTFLTTLARVKDSLGITGSSEDQALTNVISAVSLRMQRYMKRDIVQGTATAEKYDGDGRCDTLQLRNFPVISPPTPVVRVEGTAVTDFELDAETGHLIRLDNYSGKVWDRGRRNIEVDYTHGYSTVPEDLAQAALDQVNLVWSRRGQTIRDRGSVLESGSAQYLTGPWASGVVETMWSYRDRVLR